ncbi:MAG: ABC transporter ATP-binding protein/permease [Clostridia bacterium]|nr:ABC transporter ATP-binding protein/permease [Clostridia bacterium]
MLNLKNITKDYKTGNETVAALRGVSLRFRKNEFVSVLGQSGCGKTTLLNIIGGLDRYTSGDLVIAGKSTKQFRESDWDNYRNRSIGFVFQSYNLIPHQTVLANVELALTLSGVSKQERRRRAKEVLTQVGLGDQLKKKPNQMSGGQMQRVAIARALVNNPEILLADEPTGALDSETSVQIMELLKEVAKDRLVIMVTHNPELAQEYSTRIIKLLDGKVIGDSDPYTDEMAEKAEAAKPTEKAKGKKKKPSMSFFTALSLSLNNLLTKKARTILTSFAGSIGIIGIALIMSVSTGVQAYIDGIEQNTMASYPITINESTMDTTAMMSSFMTSNNLEKVEQEEGKIYSNNVMLQIMDSMTSGITTNNLKDFKAHLDSKSEELAPYINDIKYSYLSGLNTYFELEDGTYRKGITNMLEMYDALGMSMDMGGMETMSPESQSAVWTELVGESDYISDTYTLLHGSLPEKYDEVVLIVDENNQISDFTLFSLGINDVQELKNHLDAAKEAIVKDTENEYEIDAKEVFTFEELCKYKFKVLTNADYYEYDEDKKLISEATDAQVLEKLGDALELKIVGIVTPAEEDSANTIGTIGYIKALTDKVIEKVNENPAVKAQYDNKETDLFTGLSFEKKEYTPAEIRAFLSQDPANAGLLQMPDAALLKLAEQFMSTQATYDGNLSKLGFVDKEKPTAINIYPKDFESKDFVTQLIKDYNEKAEEKDKITYTDTVAMLMSSVTTIVNAISYVLIAFVAISLIVSSIMIGIITYISVLERTKEIGILRSIGASKKDISRVFNAETTIVGLTAGAFGIGITLLLLIPINAILLSLTGIATLKGVLPLGGAIALIVISVALTFIAGLIPSRFAAKRDPVEALRTE